MQPANRSVFHFRVWRSWSKRRGEGGGKRRDKERGLEERGLKTSPFSVTMRDLFIWTYCADVLGSKSRWNYSVVACLVSRLQKKLPDTEDHCCKFVLVC